MAWLVESGNNESLKTTDRASSVFYVIMLTLEAYKIQDNTTIDVQLITAGGLVVKSQYLWYIQVNTNWYWNKHP